MKKKNHIHLFMGSLLLACLAFVGCMKEEAKMTSGAMYSSRQAALKFTQALAAREYIKAQGMMAKEYRNRISVDLLRTSFETIVPLSWGPIGPIDVGETMTSWQGKQPSDQLWAYVSIGGNVCSEAVIVIVAAEDGTLKIRSAEFGRP